MEGTLHEYKERSGKCPDCGNSPVPHFPTYLAQTFDVWATTRRRSRLRSLGEYAFDLIARAGIFLGELLRIIRYGDDITRARTYRSQVIWEEAQARGIDMQQMLIFGYATDIYRARLGGRWQHFASLPIPPRMAQDYGWIDDKFLLKEALRSELIPVPRFRSVTSIQEAGDAMQELGKVAVKPRSGSRGRHTTTRVSDVSDLDRAFESAQKLCRYVAIEEHLSGSVCRGTVVDGQLVGFLEARAPRVTGDGLSTIEALIERKNASKPERVERVSLTAEHEAYLERLGYSAQSVLENGIQIDLTHRTGRLFGGVTRELLDTVHPSLRAYLERAAQVIQAPVVGFDLIIQNPEEDPDSQKWGIIEANSLPYIDLHYLPLYGKPSRTATAVWDLWESRLTP